MKNRYLYILLTGIALVLVSFYQYQNLIKRVDKLTLTKKEVEHQLLYTREEGNSKLIPNTVTSKDSKPNFTLNARGAILLDASNNRVLYEKNGYDEMAMASTTKIMTCIIALENGNLEDEVEFSKYAASMPDVQLNAKRGEKFYLRDLLYSLMLESHNDTAVAIAEHIGGSVEGFAALMNKKAKELGCTNTNFVTPNGLDNEKHYTTAYDLARIASYAIQNETFVKITNTPTWTFHEVASGRSFAVTNKDRFLYLMEGAIGVKTGFTNNAGYCFVGALKRDNKTFISVVLGSGWPPNKTYKWKDTTNLMNYGLNNYEYQDITDQDKVFKAIPVIKGKEQKVNVAVKEDELTLLLKADDVIKVDYAVSSYLQAPIAAGEVIGTANYYVNDMLVKEVPIYTVDAVDEMDFEYCRNRVLQLFLEF